MPIPQRNKRNGILQQINGLTQKITGTLSKDVVGELATKSGFCQRRSKLDAMSFLKMVLFDQMRIEQPSLDQHCRLFLQDDGRSFCKQALDKRFNSRAVAFMKCLFERYLQHQFLSSKLPSAFADHFTSIRLMDSTEFKLPESLKGDFPGFDGDGPKACMQLQFEYDILSGKIMDLAMMGAHLNDHSYAHPLLSNVRPKELIIRDLGYCKIDSFKEIQARNAYYISRFRPGTKIYERCGEGLTPLDHKTLYQRLKRSRKKQLDLSIFVGKEAKHPVRLVATLLPAEAVARRRKKKRYCQNAHPEIYNYLVYMNLFITNVSNTMLSVSQITDLYRVRWQIELIFKTWKSILKIHKVRKMKTDRLRCYLLGKFLWILINWEMYSVFNRNLLERKQGSLSIYKCHEIIKDQVDVLQGFILGRRRKLSSWLSTLYGTLSQFALKDDRKGINLNDLLALK